MLTVDAEILLLTVTDMIYSLGRFPLSRWSRPASDFAADQGEIENFRAAGAIYTRPMTYVKALEASMFMNVDSFSPLTYIFHTVAGYGYRPRSQL
jgi:hypothetical protein